ncbi:PREDICTED: UDP-glycosyltransferase 91C1 [Camelina sativa]|uniref:UDP-glycosyltransferase 91C1 n=1 Tax=Camelina sativa TaxID=90675 RepID=A0ABM0UKE8_CAMSA|nr:PREDICTED: UDP-glycosyltransferase 91C1 [Camelina sativa]
MEDKREEEVMHIAMFPWLAMGHLLPFLSLSKLLAQKGHKISFISTPRNLERLPKLPSNLSSSITFVSFPLPLISGLSPTSESSMDVPYNKQQSLKAAFDLLQAPLKEFLGRSSPDWIIFDYASHWLPSIAAELGISKAFFSLFNAATLCFLGPSSSLIDELRTTPEDFTVVPPWVPFKSNIAFRYHEVTRYVEKTDEDVTGVSDSVRFGYSIGESDAVFVRSCPEFEPEWFGLLKDLYQKPVFPSGFLPPVIEEDDDDDTTWVRIKEWLDKQRVNSVVYVSLGTEASLRREEVTELALGLEKSETPFFWVLRNEPHIPDGFEETVKGRGMVHVGWVPQVKILRHESVGGFLTHCGWNSVVEGLGFGKAPIFLPVLNEQGLNTRLLHGKGIGVEVLRDERDGSFDSCSVADSVRLVMVDEEGESIRDKAKLMKGLFGNMDENIRHVDEIVSFMTSKGSSSLSSSSC